MATQVTRSDEFGWTHGSLNGLSPVAGVADYGAPRRDTRGEIRVGCETRSGNEVRGTCRNADDAVGHRRIAVPMHCLSAPSPAGAPTREERVAFLPPAQAERMFCSRERGREGWQRGR